MSAEKNLKKSSLDFSRVGPIFVLVLVDILGLTVILPLLHLYAAAYGATAFEIGVVAAAFPIAQLIGVPLMGALSDRYGRKPLLLISQITTFISFLILGFSNSLGMIIFARVLDGLFGANIATAQAALSDITDEENRAQGLGLIGAAFGLGFIFGPITALIALEIADSLAAPAFTAAVYSLLSILITTFVFRETLPPEKRGEAKQSRLNPFVIVRYLRNPNVNILLVVMFAQQVIFFGFESLLGLFTLSRLGLLGQGNTIIFLVVGITLVIVQGGLIGRWSRRYGERKLIFAALAILSAGLIMLALTPEQPHPFYVQRNVAYDLAGEESTSSTEAILGDINVALPDDSNRGFGGIVWVIVAIIPLSIGAALLRPSLNSMMTQRVAKGEYGSILGVSSSFSSAANAISPIIGGLLFQRFGATVPFLLGGIVMFGIFLLSLLTIKPLPKRSSQE